MEETAIIMETTAAGLIVNPAIIAVTDTIITAAEEQFQAIILATEIMIIATITELTMAETEITEVRKSEMIVTTVHPFLIARPNAQHRKEVIPRQARVLGI